MLNKPAAPRNLIITNITKQHTRRKGLLQANKTKPTDIQDGGSSRQVAKVAGMVCTSMCVDGEHNLCATRKWVVMADQPPFSISCSRRCTRQCAHLIAHMCASCRYSMECYTCLTCSCYSCCLYSHTHTFVVVTHPDGCLPVCHQLFCRPHTPSRAHRQVRAELHGTCSEH